MRELEGELEKVNYGLGGDSNALIPERSVKSNYTTRQTRLHIGEVVLVHPEPAYAQMMASVRIRKGGILTTVAVPGPNVALTPAGIPAGAGAIGIHGLYDPPLPGQEVVLGFIGGNAYSPVVLAKLPYNASDDPTMEVAHTAPMTKFGHMPLDIVLGHFNGSYLAFRSMLPIPGNVELKASASLNLSSKLNTNVSALANVNISSVMSTSIDAVMSVALTGKMSVSMADGTTGITKVAIDAVLGKVDIVGLNNIAIKSIGGMVMLGKAPANFVNNLPACIFSGAIHSTCLDVKA